MLSLFPRPKPPCDPHDSFIVCWSGYPIGVLYETNTLPPPLRYVWAKNLTFGPCYSGNAETLDAAKADFKRHWLNCLDSIGLTTKPESPHPADA